MKYISIITGSDLRMVMGVNYFIKSFIQCNEFFNDVQINRVYSGVQTLAIDKNEPMPIGNDLGTTEYKIRRGVRTLLRKLLTDKFYPFALLRYILNIRSVSKKSVERFLADEIKCDYIIFQELGCAEYFFKHKNEYTKNKDVKTMLVIHSEDDSCSMTLESFRGYGRKDMEKRLFKMRDYVYGHIDKVMYISRKAYQNSILPDSKKAFVYNGSPDVPFSYIKRDDGITQFVCVGSIEGRKGQDKIIEALHLIDSKHLNKIHVTMVGGGSKETELKVLAKEYNLEDVVSFAGHRNDVPDILKGMDVFIMPSTVEGLPMSAIEAMRAGLFLILTDTGGNAELCEDGCGFVCTREPQNIVKEMNSVLETKIVNESQKKNSYNRFLNCFSLSSMAKGYESVLVSMSK